MNKTILANLLNGIVKHVPDIVPYLSQTTVQALKAADSYDGIRAMMHDAIYNAVYGYLSSTGYVPRFRLDMATAVSQGYVETSDIAYAEGGGELPIDEETATWARGQLDAQLQFIDQLFETLKDLRKSGGFDAGDVANVRADGWASALDGFYTEMKMRGSKNVVLTWQLGATEKHCETCAKLDGQSHKISWYLERNYIPRKPAASMECGGWNCDCSLVDRFGNEYTVST